MLRIFHNPNYDFIRWWRWAAGLTLAWMLIGVASYAVNPSVNWSIEFTGGTLMQLEFKQPVEVSDIRSTIEQAGVHGAEIQQFGSNREFTVRAQNASQTAGADSAGASGASGTPALIRRALDAKYGADRYTLVRTETVGPKVGAELRRGAAIAMLIASLVTLVYLAFRFEWRFGVAAVITTAHDVLVTLALIKIAHIEVSLTVVAAILTLLGYSMNDTIIIFDRVRENMKRQRSHSFAELRAVLNRSINETLPRSVLTHATTLAATLALLFLAGEVIRPFAWVMAFGVFIATFSSIYVASPLLMWIEHKWPRAEPGAATGGSSRTESSGQRPPKPPKAERAAAARTSAQPTR